MSEARREPGASGASRRWWLWQDIRTSPPITVDPTQDASLRARTGSILPWLAAVWVAGIVAYWGTTRAGFVYDDLLLVLQNPSIRDFDHWGNWLTRSFWRDVYNPADADRIPYYRPLMTCALALGHLLSGENPLGYHLLALGLHLIASSLVLVVGRRWLGTPAAGAAALLFVTTPVHVEAVAWISGMAEPLAATLGLSASWLALRTADGITQRQRPARTALWMAAAGLVSMSAYFAKETAVTVPFTLAVVDALATPGWRLRRALAFVPALLALVPYAAARIVVFGPSAGLGIQQTQFGLPAWRMASLPFELFSTYLWTLLYPFDLCSFRTVRVDLAPGDSLVMWGAAGAGGFVVLLAAGFAASWKWRLPRLAPALLLATALPVLPFVVKPSSLGFVVFGERFLYAPSIAFCWLLGWLLAALAGWSRWIAGAACVAGVAAYGIGTSNRVEVWMTEQSLYETSSREAPDSATVRRELGRLAWEKYQQTQDVVDLDLAFAHFQSVIDKKLRDRVFVASDDVIQAQLGLAACHLARGRAESALSVAEQILEVYPLTSEAANLAGVSAEILGNSDAAERHFRRAIEIRPTYAEALFNLGHLFFRRREFARAILELQKCIEVQPTHVDAILELGSCYMNLQRFEDAVRVLDQALQIRPDHPAAPALREALAPYRTQK